MAWPAGPVLKQVEEAIHRTRGRAVKRATPVRLPMLLAAAAQAASAPWCANAEAAVTCMLLSHHCLLRSKELIACKWSDLTLAPDGAWTLSIEPAHDKTNRRHTARSVVLPPDTASPLLSRLRALQRESASPFICPWRSYSAWRGSVAQTASSCGWPPGVRTHSFRSGGATDLLECGAPVEDVRRLGRWASDAFLTYWRPRPAEIAAHIGSALRLASGVSSGRPRALRRPARTRGRRS